MVLGTKLKLFTIVSLLLFGVSCNATSNRTDVLIDKATLNKHDFALYDASGKCILEYSVNNEVVKTSLPLIAPCHFARNTSSGILHYAYKDRGIKATLAVIGNPVSNEARKQWNLDSNIICGEKAVGVLITNDTIRLSKTLLEGGVMCASKGLDEKDFWSLAHD
ncbi:MAG: hypothetical protein OQK98_15025 [Gammaproteobacteria bacterium]|nr:hypothetical protein [Gammaproteobacteria bacterium]